MRRERLDLLLVERGLAPSREQARAAVMAGEVQVDGRPASKPGILVSSAATISLEPRRPRYASRGGIKLAHALATFNMSAEGLVAMDVGASTGGFTDVLLQGGARRVYAVDVGTGQLEWRLRQDPRVIVRERTHAARLTAGDIPEPIDLATVDLSFISLTRVLPAVAARMRRGGEILALVKPQFEAGRRLVRGGVVRSAATHHAVLQRLAAWVADRQWRITGISTSPLPGPKGNREFFLRIALPATDEKWSVTGDPSADVNDEVSGALDAKVEAMVAAAVAEAHR